MKYLVAIVLMAYVASAAIVDNPYQHVGCYTEIMGPESSPVLDGGHKESAHYMQVEYCIGLCTGAVSVHG